MGPEAAHMQSLPRASSGLSSRCSSSLPATSTEGKARLQEIRSLCPSPGHKINTQAWHLGLVTPPQDTARCWHQSLCVPTPRLAPHPVGDIGLTFQWNLRGPDFPAHPLYILSPNQARCLKTHCSSLLWVQWLKHVALGKSRKCSSKLMQEPLSDLSTF